MAGHTWTLSFKTGTDVTVLEVQYDVLVPGRLHSPQTSPSLSVFLFSFPLNTASHHISLTPSPSRSHPLDVQKLTKQPHTSAFRSWTRSSSAHTLLPRLIPSASRGPRPSTQNIICVQGASHRRMFGAIAVTKSKTNTPHKRTSSHRACSPSGVKRPLLAPIQHQHPLLHRALSA
ncbi:hypothetical protein GALMADRAFT_1249426 [Galerina marginata CBS 339.88]|uniref:Uncharacterized protein n=1 Tax=Galerina marginata (strain CBS 339.88) TaxID=685588 RepID=A0A067TEW4_GALM3|nr:hypothetical protein GALMADRAFT_1249426 [Galerina marginata CBS 339.88]